MCRNGQNCISNLSSHMCRKYHQSMFDSHFPSFSNFFFINIIWNQDKNGQMPFKKASASCWVIHISQMNCSTTNIFLKILSDLILSCLTNMLNKMNWLNHACKDQCFLFHYHPSNRWFEYVSFNTSLNTTFLHTYYNFLMSTKQASINKN